MYSEQDWQEMWDGLEEDGWFGTDVALGTPKQLLLDEYGEREDSEYHVQAAIQAAAKQWKDWDADLMAAVFKSFQRTYESWGEIGHEYKVENYGDPNNPDLVSDEEVGRNHVNETDIVIEDVGDGLLYFFTKVQ